MIMSSNNNNNNKKCKIFQVTKVINREERKVLDEKLQDYIESIQCIDHHCHNVMDEPSCFKLPLITSLCEANLENNNYFKTQSTSSLTYKRTVKELCELYNTTPDVLETRREAMGINQITETCFQNANVEALILDDSFIVPNHPIKPTSWHCTYATIYKVIRIEPIVEHQLLVAKKMKWSWNEFVDSCTTLLTPPANGYELQSDNITLIPVIGFKSIVAYRTGLKVEKWSEQQAKEEFNSILNTQITEGQSKYRLMSKIMIDYFLRFTMRIANNHKPHPLPVQFHTGFGDSDLDLENANPLSLKSIILEFPNVPIVLLHCAYPYSREGAYLCWIYPNVYIDIGLAIPTLSVSGMKSSISSMMELAPIDKIIYSSDSHHIPEIFYLASKWARKVIYTLLIESIDNQEINHTEAMQFIAKIFRNNVIHLYHLDLKLETIENNNTNI